MIGGKLQKDRTLTKTHLRRGDVVRVICGRERGKEGKILNISRVQNKVRIEQLNMVKKHTRPNQKHPQGGIIEKEGMLALSNVMIVCSNCERPVRLGAKQLSDGKRIRICGRCGEAMDKDAF